MASFTTVVLPLLLVVLTGFVSGAGKWLDITAARLLARYVFLFAMPIAVFNFYTKAPPPGPEVFPFMAAFFLAMLIAILLSIFTSQKLLGLSVRESGAHGFVSICGNAVFLGLPIALSIEGWGQPFLMLMIIEGIFVFGISAAVMTWPEANGAQPKALQQLGKNLGKSLLLPFKNPIVVASLLGVCVAFAGVEFPEPLLQYLGFFGGTAGPTGLFVLGLYMAILPKEGLRESLANVSLVVLVKLLLFPLLAGTFIWFATGGDKTLVGTGVLFAAMPPAIASIVQASHYKLYEKETVSGVVAGSLLSLVGLAVVLSVFAG
jgi:hypothetical protein